MTLHRFFVPSSAIGDGVVTLPREASRQITKVLRLRPGDEIVVFDGSGAEWPATLLEGARSSAVIAELADERAPASESHVHLVLCQALIKADRFEFILQKATELGAGSFRPLVTARTVRERPSPARVTRWGRIVREAAEQSGRVRVPTIEPPAHLEEMRDGDAAATLLLWEGESRRSFTEAADDLRPRLSEHEPALNLVCGPEGGFEQEEVDFLQSRGAIAAGLGPRLLRAETAAIAALTLALHELGELVPAGRAQVGDHG